jgi:DNA phosphorothioation-dependent restriction protein DptH
MWKIGQLSADQRAAHLGVVSDLAAVHAGPDGEARNVAVPDTSTSFRNLLTPASNQRVTSSGATWRTAPAVRVRNRDGAADAVEAHRAYQAALADHLGHTSNAVALTASLGAEELASLRAAHERSDWVLTLDRNLGIDHYSASPRGDGSAQPYILDYAPDFLEGLGPRLTVTTTHRGEVQRLLADAMDELDLATVDQSVRVVLDHLQVVSGRLALRLIGRTSLATEAVSLAALMAHLRRRGELDGAVVVPVDAHQEVFGSSGAEAVARRCDLVLVRTTARTMRLDCIEVKSRRASTIPAALVDDIVEQLDSTVTMLRDTFFRLDPPRIDAELQRARLGGILRHHADRALAMGLLDDQKRADFEKLVERVEDGALVPEIGRRGYVVSLGGSAGLPTQHRGVRIEVLTAADLDAVGIEQSTRAGSASAPENVQPVTAPAPTAPPAPVEPTPPVRIPATPVPATAAGIPVEGVTETLPVGVNDYVAWQSQQIDTLAKDLGSS